MTLLGDLGKDIRYMADLTLSNFKFLLKQVALEILDCGDEAFIQKYIPPDTVEYLMKPEPLEDISSAFYLPRLTQSTEVSVEEKPSLSRKKSVSKQISSKSAIAVDNQLSNEEVGYLLSQEDNSWINENESPFDYNDELFQSGTVARATPGKKANKGKRKKSGTTDEFIEPSLIRLPSTITPLVQWEQDCFDMLKKITRHEFLDLSKPNPKVFKADFFHPVVELFPDLATAYLQEIKNPMDFTIIYDRLTRHGFLDCQDVYEKIILIFQNTIDFNEPHINENDHSPDAEFARKMVSRSKHMIKYVKWLANEMLPVVDDSNELHPEALGELRTSLREEYRKERMDIINNAPIDVHRDCNALLKKFENRKYLKDYLYFSRPVPVKDVHDYLVYVRHPMDFYTVKEKLDKHKYATFGHFIKDLRLIFSNAKTYNKVHMDNDPVSKSCYESAVMLSDKLEAWLCEDFSIDVAERVLYNRIKMDEGAIVEAQRKEIKEKMDQELDEFRKQEIARMKSTDLMFAADQMRREYISGTLEPGANTSILTPRSSNAERPPIFYEPETVEIAIPQSTATPNHATQPNLNVSNSIIRENAWSYWKSQGCSLEKQVLVPPDGMELVRSDSESRLSRSDSRDSHESMKQIPEVVAPTVPSDTDRCLNVDKNEFHLSSFQLLPLRKKLKTSIGSSTSRVKKSTLIAFVDDDSLPSPTPDHTTWPTSSLRAKRAREKDGVSAEQTNKPKKLRTEEQTTSHKDSTPSNRETELHLLNFRNITSFLTSDRPVTINHFPIDYFEETVESDKRVETIVMRYRTCNGINLFRILTPCYREYDNSSTLDDPNTIAQPIALEEQKSQSSSIPETLSLGRESSLTLSDHSPATVIQPIDQNTAPQSLESNLKQNSSLLRTGTGPEPLLLRSLTTQAALNAKRKSDIDNIRKVLSSMSRSTLEQKFKEDFFRKKLLGVFGDKKGGDDLRKRALSFMKSSPEGIASIHHVGTRLKIVYPLKSSVHLHPSNFLRERNEIELTITPPLTREVVSSLFGSSYSAQSLSQYSELYTAGFEMDRGLSHESNCFEYTACFHSGKSLPLPSHRWHRRLDNGCICHTAHQHYLDTHLRIRRNVNDPQLYSVHGILPIAGVSDGKSSHHWSPRINISLQQISQSTFISPSCQEVNYMKIMKNNETPSWQKFVEIWIMFIGDYPPSDQSPGILPTVDLRAK